MKSSAPDRGVSRRGPRSAMPLARGGRIFILHSTKGQGAQCAWGLRLAGNRFDVMADASYNTYGLSIVPIARGPDCCGYSEGRITMDFKGVARGNIVELERPLPYPNGQVLSVSVQVLSAELQAGSALAVREAMHEAPHLSSSDVDELERAIEEGRLPLRSRSVFEPED